MQVLGYEFAKFRLRVGVQPRELLEASYNEERYFLRHEQGFVSRSLVALEDGDYMDLLVAETKTDAERICANWQGNIHCEAFLSLINTETVSIGFGEELVA